MSRTPSAPAPAPAAPRIQLGSAPVAQAPVPNPTEGGTVELPLRVIISKFPQELAALVVAQPAAEAIYRVSLDFVLQQLSKGIVTVPFGDIRHQAPAGVFVDDASRDVDAVVIPLSEIIARVAPNQLSRRPAQKQVVVPDDVTAPFRTGAKVSAPAAPRPMAPQAAPAPALAPAPVTPPRPTVAPRIQVPTPTPAPAAQTAPAPTRISLAPSNPAPAPTPVAPAPAPVARAVAPAPAPKPAPAPVAAPVAAPSDLSGSIRVELQRLMDNWPQAVGEEVAELGLKDEFVELPMSEIEAGLRSGKLVFTWNQLRSWMPAVAKVIATSPNDSAPLELPLRVIAPLFLAQKKVGAAAPKAKSADFDSIPNLFGPGAGAAAPQVSNTAPVAAPAAKPAAAAPASAPLKMAAPAPAPVVAKPKPQTIAEVLGSEPGANTTPGEIARRAAGLPGMTGALICTSDGLVVAEHFVSPVGSETFCALMTQMFNRVTGYAKELRLGSPAEMAFVIDGATYQIFQTPRVFVIAVGKPGEALPVHELRIIAEYLGK